MKQIESIVCDLAVKHSKYDLALGYLRYEALRTLSVQKFSELYQRNLKGENFDEMIDEMIIESNIYGSKNKGSN